MLFRSHLETHWPGGLMLWAIGAGLGWLLLRQWPQLTVFALLTPAWLISEWIWLCTQWLPDTRPWSWHVFAVQAAGTLLLCVVYLGAQRGTPTDPSSRVLAALGDIGFLPAAAGWLGTLHFNNSLADT